MDLALKANTIRSITGIFISPFSLLRSLLDLVSPQYTFARNDLEKASKDPQIDWIIVYYHRPAYTSASFDVQKAEKIRETYHQMFDVYGVDLVLQAHNHYYERTYPLTFNPFNSSNPLIGDTEQTQYKDPNGRIFLTVGTGGGDFHTPAYQMDYFVNTYVGRGCLIIEIDEKANKLEGDLYSLDDKTIDNFSIEKTFNQSSSYTDGTFPSAIA
jgi:hypothetical protein